MDISSRANSCMFNMSKTTLLGSDTEVISMYEPAAIRRQRLIVSIDVEQHFLAAVRYSGPAIGSSCHLAVQRIRDC